MTTPNSRERDDQVRALLAGVREDEGTPTEVASRLDDVLARLEAGEDVPGPASPASVVELAAVRRRRVVRLLAGAAAVVVLGVGVGNGIQYLSGGTSGNDSASSAASSLTQGDAADSSAGRTSEDDGGGAAESGNDTFSDQSGSDQSGRLQVPVKQVLSLDGTLQPVSEAAFADDARHLRSRLRAGEGTAAAGAGLGADWQACTPADWGRGRLLAVEYDGRAAVLAYRPSEGETQVVDVLQCGSGDVLRSATLTGR
ncbi:hypothetical protein [Nocardioides bruguierae]|uniref:Uncharacterized protein n=1 Tax=Nocardioides bruguierae TaxID=2945102 RepID=A0A9X2DAE4_9ACTN|nr:hypothetical protein [Nocardioides bruguierae]MCM0620969.1 hypothetical protein [Nocardioides bruguierae]